MKRISREELVPRLKKISDVLDRISNDSTISKRKFAEGERVALKMIDELSEEIDVPDLMDYYYQYDLTAEEIADALFNGGVEED